MRRFLDNLYLATGWAAAFIILGIAVLISAQVLLNFATRVFGLPLPSTIPSYADFAGFMLAAATFLAMPYTLRSGGHIRVSLVTARLPRRAQFGLELGVLVLSAAFVGYACWFCIALVLESLHFNDLSNGIVPIPLWIPQAVMSLGMTLLWVSLIDSLVQTWARGAPVIQHAEEV